MLYGIEVMEDALYQLFARAMQMKVPVQERVIRVGSQEYIFDIYKHILVVDDAEALMERTNGTKAISEEQEIIFYVPERQI